MSIIVFYVPTNTFWNVGTVLFLVLRETRSSGTGLKSKSTWLKNVQSRAIQIIDMMGPLLGNQRIFQQPSSTRLLINQLSQVLKKLKANVMKRNNCLLDSRNSPLQVQLDHKLISLRSIESVALPLDCRYSFAAPYDS